MDLMTNVSFEEQGKAAQKKTEAERVKDTRHSLAVAEYARSLLVLLPKQ